MHQLQKNSGTSRHQRPAKGGWMNGKASMQVQGSSWPRNTLTITIPDLARARLNKSGKAREGERMEKACHEAMTMTAWD